MNRSRDGFVERGNEAISGGVDLSTVVKPLTAVQLLPSDLVIYVDSHPRPPGTRRTPRQERMLPLPTSGGNPPTEAHPPRPEGCPALPAGDSLTHILSRLPKGYVQKECLTNFPGHLAWISSHLLDRIQAGPVTVGHLEFARSRLFR